jgi:iron complex transport system permease protein
MFTKQYTYKFGFLFILLLLCLVLNVSLGSVNIPFKEVFSALTGGEVNKQTWQYIIIDYRLPKAITALWVGAGLALSGLLMQTLFRNPLAGPFVLGISSGASLGVAVVIMGSSLLGGWLATKASITLAATLGSFLVLLTVMSVAHKVRDTMALLIIGLMFGSITSAVVSVLSYFTNSEKLQQYIFWSFGSLGDLSWHQLSILSLICVLGIVLSVFMLKKLDALLLGEKYAKSLGVNIKTTRYIIIIATSILAGGITAFAGPIAFVGLAVPHLAKQFFNTTLHYILIPGVFLCGSILMLLCDTIAQLPNTEYTLPINAITSIVGAPVVIWLLVRKRKMIF